jgi:Amt family ammonium transporter
VVGAIGLTFLLRNVPDDGIGTQLWYQVEAVLVSIVYAGVVTLILCFLVEKTVGFRMKEEDEMAGMDHSLHSEQGYGLINLN